MIVSAGYIKPQKIIARGNYFVVNDKKVRGIYVINNKYSYLWDKTKIYWYAVQESNIIDPIMIDKINNYMKTNRIVELRYRDIKQGIRLRLLEARRERKEALGDLQSEETDLVQVMNEAIDEGLDKIAKEELELSEERKDSVELTDKKKAKLLLDFLLERQAIDQQQHINFFQSINKDDITFDNLIDELRETHELGIVEPLNEDIERFIRDLGKQRAQEWAGHSQDLRSTKRGLGEMVARPVIPSLSLYGMIAASFLKTFFKDIEIHFSNNPVALTIEGRKITARTLIRRGPYCIFNNRNINGVYEINEESQYMWNKTLCQVYHLTNHKEEDTFITDELRKYFVTRKLLTISKESKDSQNPNNKKSKPFLLRFNSGKKEIIKKNVLLDYLLKEGRIDTAFHDEILGMIKSKKVKLVDFVEVLREKGIIQTTPPLYLDVEGFIDQLGAMNAQEWAGHVQDMRNSKKLLNDMTKIPVKSFLSGGIILAIGLVAIMAVAVIGLGGGGGILKEFGPSASGGGGGFSFIPNFGHHFLLPLAKEHFINFLGWFR